MASGSPLRSMKMTVIWYSVAIAIAAFLLQWLEYTYAIRLFSTQIYIAIIALSFTALGIWVGMKLTQHDVPQQFEQNHQALSYLGISKRELEVLEQLAKGCSNQEIAHRLHVSNNTVKTHLSHVYQKLQVVRRTQAVEKARSLKIIP